MIKLIKSLFYREKDTKEKLCRFISGTDRLSIGPECRKFEEKFAQYQGRKYAVFFNSGSSANLAIIQTLINLGKIKQGDLAGFSALTWATNPMPLIQLGLKSVPIDVELDTLNISSRKLKQTLKKYPLKLMFLTNLLGFCDDIDKIQEVCRKNNIILLEDNCESLGTVYKNKKLGNYGLASSFSFFVGHHISTVEGGAVCTDDEEIAVMLKLVRAHGWDRNLSQATQLVLRNQYGVESTFYSKYTFYDLGYNLRPTEINAFIGNIQVNYIDEIVKKRQRNFKKLASRIYAQKSNYFPIRCDHITVLSNFAFPVICKSTVIRNRLIEKCEGKVEIRPIVGGDMTKQPFFKKYMPEYSDIIKNSNARLINENGLYFGNNPELTDEEIGEIISIFT